MEPRKNRILIEAKTWSIDGGLVLLCFVLGIALRMGAPADWSFINDELSTWAKVSYGSVAEVIENIKQVDSHPVGMYVFVYYWTGLFGTSEWAIKLPFFLMSIVSMGLVYRLSTIWFSRSVALLVLASFSTLQFPIWWSHIARQYQSGLFCTLLMAYFWTKILLEKRDELGYWLGFVLMGAAAMYNHYFSLIFAALIGVSGLFWIRKEIWWKYLGAGFLMLLLFIPHISITQYQLMHADGHLWYQLPTPKFFAQHIFYIFHYSYWALGLAVGASLGAWLVYQKARANTTWNLRLLALFWFSTPIIFGYLYSVYKSPILRESHLLFSFPYLLFFLWSFFPKDLGSKQKIGLVLLILGVNSSTLILTRKHYQTVHTHPYEHFIKHTKTFLSNHDREDVSIVLGENPQYLQYYKDLYRANFEHIASFKAPIPFLEFREILQNSVTSHLIIGSLPEAYIHMARDYYPYLYQKSYGINYEYYILSKEKTLDQCSWELDFETEMQQETSAQKGWNINPIAWAVDSLAGQEYYVLREEWGPTFDISLAEISPRNNQFLEIAIDVKMMDTVALQPTGTLVLELRDEQDSLWVWKGVEAAWQTTAEKGWQRMYLSVRLAHEKIYHNVKKFKMKAFFWNKKKQAILLRRFSINSRKGNQLLYGDTNKFD